MSGKRFDVVIVGGGVIGSAIAFFLTREPGLSVAVIEPDPTYEWAATPRSAGGIRTQFSTPANIRMSLFGADFLRAAPDLLAVDGDRPFFSFREQGYLILASAGGAAQLGTNHALQTACGAEVSLLDPDALARRFPWLDPGGIALGAIGERHEGWFDPYSLLQAFRRKARAQGADYITDQVAAIDRAGAQVTGVRLQSGRVIGAGTLVNAAGWNGRRIAAMAGIGTLPVFRKKRQIFVFSCREPVERMPLTVDPSGVYCRPEHEHFICGLAPQDDDAPEDTSFEVDHDQFERDIWPVLANRVPQFGAIRVINAWAGHYDVNNFDHNAILGPHPEVANFIFANGFSGHGLQQSPAVGRALAELIVTGGYRTLDLSDHGFDRIAANRTLRERNVF